MSNIQLHEFVEVKLSQVVQGKGEWSWKPPQGQRVFCEKMVAVMANLFFGQTLQACLLRKNPAKSILS